MINALWIKAERDLGDICPIFKKDFSIDKKVKTATLKISAGGLFFAELNGKKVGDKYLTPGWTSYHKRIQYEEYDVTAFLCHSNTVAVTLAKGWYLGRMSTGEGWTRPEEYTYKGRQNAIIAELHITFFDGTDKSVATDLSWKCAESSYRLCDIYDGIIYNAAFEPNYSIRTVIAGNMPTDKLVKRQGDPVVANEKIKPQSIFKTPNGETVIDFGRNISGVLSISLSAHEGDKCDFSFGEVLDRDGNFYNANYRDALCYYKYTCREGNQNFTPEMTYYGFRYVRINKLPIPPEMVDFTAVVLHTKMERTGYFNSSDTVLNKFFDSIIWSQKGNFLDVPTDCPQRDERIAWSGDAQLFCRVGTLNFNAKKFYRKWLTDMRLEQGEDGWVPNMTPSVDTHNYSAGWADAITICPWQMYLTYGDMDLLEEMYPAMKKWVDFVTRNTTTEYMWTGIWQFGDWLELNAPYGEAIGKTRPDIIATAYYANSALIVAKSAEALGMDGTYYRILHSKIVDKFRDVYKDDFKTQTECTVAIYFNLAKNITAVADKLKALLKENNYKRDTGFIGTAYILYALSNTGNADLAYKLLLDREYPSWLYPVTLGATTTWEHWDSIDENGKMWPEKMNSFNHYAYGAAGDWLYRAAAGIMADEQNPGFSRVIIKPFTTELLDFVSAEIKTSHGVIKSEWKHENGGITYKIITPVPAVITINGKTTAVESGEYEFKG